MLDVQCYLREISGPFPVKSIDCMLPYRVFIARVQRGREIISHSMSSNHYLP
jgi:hypothetical protein